MFVVYALQVSLALLNSCLFFFFLKNLNVVFVTGEHDFNYGYEDLLDCLAAAFV